MSSPSRGRASSANVNFSTVEGFVKDRQGTRVINKILLANNGIAAVKAIRSIRQWSYRTFGDEKAVTFVAMYTPDDLAARASRHPLGPASPLCPVSIARDVAR